MKAWLAGNVAGTGTFRCSDCDYSVSLDAAEELPVCPSCGGREFIRSSLFTTAQTTMVELPSAGEDRSWIEELRDGVDEPGQYLAYRAGDGEVIPFPLRREWTRIGRRHALIVRQPDGLRVLDDRSLNGVFVNGERVEWSTLADGDEIVIGRHHLHFLDVPVVSGMRFSATPEHDTV
jgi:DNA-directed RNA polymerase subunit RPC12/RpoP